MINVTLVASTPQEASALSQEKYGNDFRLISARQIQLADRESTSCEITVSISRERFLQLNEAEDGGVAREEEMLMNELSLLRDQITEIKEDLQEGEIKQKYSQEAFENSQIERASVKPLIEKIKSFFYQKGIAMEWLESVLEPLIGSTVAEDEQLLVAYLLEEIDEALQIKEEVIKDQNVMMFVGPTGVGKTTTIAKLAARYAYQMDKPYRVALLNLDSFKVGAFEQLAHFAKIMQLKYVTATSVEQFKEEFNKLSEYDVILIDTAGMSPYDTEKLVKTVEYLSTDTAQLIEVNLVISATVKYEDIEDIYDTFSFLNLSSVIFSKLDETKHLGSMLSYLLLHPVPLSYFSIGQEVPDDLLIADKEYLLRRFIGDLDD